MTMIDKILARHAGLDRDVIAAGGLLQRLRAQGHL
jgi:hypothetical protein